MELRTIKYFTQLCNDLNFTVAANKLYVTQQALSKAIGNLEKELGVQLFIRGTTGLTLTEFGETFRRDVTPALDALDCAYERIQYMKDLNHVCIHFGYTFGIYVAIHMMVEEFCKEHPNIEVIVEECSDDKCEADFKAGVYDLICISEPLDPTGTTPVYECPVVLVVYKGGDLDCELTPEKLADNVLIDYGVEFNMAKRIRAAFERRGIQLKMKPETSDKTAHYSDIRKGSGAFLMSEDEAKEFVAAHPSTKYVPFPFEEDESRWRVCLKVNERSVASEEVKLFADFLEDNSGEYILSAFRDIYSL